MTSLLWNLVRKTSSQIYNSYIGAVAVRSCSSGANTTHNKLMSFFEDRKNWSKTEIKVGRAWNADELRIKSNTDLHKLWYILLKERNMLLTMEYAANSYYKVFPNPERLDKVKISMENIETVVRERNTAYHMLETGETGERTKKIVNTQLGMKRSYKFTEHLIPKFMNKKWRETHVFRYKGNAVRKFRRFMREQRFLVNKRQRNREINHVQRLLRHIPHVDLDAVHKAYPNIDIENIRHTKPARSTVIPKDFQE